MISPDDLNALAKSMDCLMANSTERQRLGACAMEVIERFSVEKVMRMGTGWWPIPVEGEPEGNINEGVLSHVEGSQFEFGES